MIIIFGYLFSKARKKEKRFQFRNMIFGDCYKKKLLKNLSHSLIRVIS